MEAIVTAVGLFFITSAANTNSQRSYTFHTLQDYIVQFEPSDTVKTFDVVIYEGEFATTRHIANTKTLEENRYLLDADRIDETTVRVRVNNTNYTRVTPETEGSLNLNERSYVFWLEENRFRALDLIFGNGVVVF